jgi:tetratricopeptide (TPR) repeat protein
MDNTIKCPACGAENKQQARFCDQCGAELNPAAASVAAAEKAVKPNRVNWTAIILTVVLLAVAGWLLFGPTDKNEPAGGNGANPHANMGGGAGEGGDPHAQEGMGDMMASIDAAKLTLRENPLDMQALGTLYQAYGMIGRSAQVRNDYLIPALAAMREQEAELGDDLPQTAIDLSMAAMIGGDPEGGILALDALVELRPDFALAGKLKGDLLAEMGDYEASIAAYEEYKGTVDPAAEADTYLQAEVNIGRVLVQQYSESLDAGEPDEGAITRAISHLSTLTGMHPELYGAWYNLGKAHALNGNETDAVAAYEEAAAVTSDEMEQWQAEAEAARLKGEEPPERPAGMAGMNPHGGGGMGGGAMGGGMGNPHAGGGMGNPHGGGMGNSDDEDDHDPNDGEDHTGHNH